MRLPIHSVGEVVIVTDDCERVGAVIISEVIIRKNEVAYKADLSLFDGDEREIFVYDDKEFDHTDGREPLFTIISTVGTYNED